MKLAKLYEISVGGKGTYGIAASAVDRCENLYTYLRITDICDDGTLNRSGLKSVDDPDAAKYILKPNDIVFARTGGSTGRNYFYDGSDGEFVYAGFLIKFSIDPEKVNPKYIKYYCQSAQYKNWVRSFNTGSTRGNINAQTFGNMEIPLPERAQQDFLVDVLSPIDEKIKINQQINDNLHEILQSVFQSRFGLSEESARVGTLLEICAYSKDRVAVSKLGVKNYYSTENMLPSKAGSVDAASLPTTSQTTKCNIGDVLVSNIRPYFKKIVFCQSEGGCSTDVLCFTPKSPLLSSYLFCTLYADSFFNYMVAGSKGTKMPRGDKRQIMTYPVVIPTEDELRAFDEVAQPILRQIHINSDENTYLAALRDTLLPKLMSGEIDVSDIQL